MYEGDVSVDFVKEIGEIFIGWGPDDWGNDGIGKGVNYFLHVGSNGGVWGRGG